ncbi:hypothetical protein OG936_34090 [Streptomyces sp. NBC_00846]|uniref:hypothetical protein n=1 Tax=Streptomyces sp. NBC_00846 TaxID=2975849 RepID=UPI00386FC97B|nr:hypothetical protein OG936_34090 [Streptomyces sp. NBC_00846]
MRISTALSSPATCSRSIAGAETSRPRIWFIAWVRALTALRRAIRRTRTASTTPSRLFGVPVARPDSTAVAAA